MSDEQEDDGSGSFESYSEYNRVLRTWFVAFGIGGPALILVNPAVAQMLNLAGELRGVVVLFLVGAASQVAGALLNKVANWYCYRAKSDSGGEGKYVYQICSWVIKQFWIDVGLDLITIVVFGIAAWQVLTVFATIT
jgi:hypothetical protein